MELFTYKYYDDSKRRLAVMCKPLDESRMEISILTCARKDQFSKEFARLSLLGKQTVQPVHIQKVIVAHRRSNYKVEFFKWMKQRFWRHEYKTIHFFTDILRKPGEGIKVLKINQQKAKWY
jgi:hypothetical protein